MGGRAAPSKLDENAKFQKQKKLETIESRLSQHRAAMATRIQASKEANGKIFRLEQLCDALSLGAFERSCILHLLQDVIMPNQASPKSMEQMMISSRRKPNSSVSIGELVSAMFCLFLFSTGMFMFEFLIVLTFIPFTRSLASVHHLRTR